MHLRSYATSTTYHFRHSTAIEQWAANALATGGHLAEIAARPGIVKLLDLLKEDDDQDSEEDSD